MRELKFTNTEIAAIPHPASGQMFYRDTQLRGLGLRVGTRTKVYYAEGQANGDTRRVSIGRTDVFTAEAARKKALIYLAEMADGINPNTRKREQEAASITLAKAFEEFFEVKPHLSPVTVTGYTRTVYLYLREWRHKPLNQLTKKMVLNKHQQLTRKHGGVSANNAMRHLRSVYNFTAATDDDFPPNPVDVLKHARAWHREKRRTTVIQRHKLPAWWEAAMDEPDYTRHLLLVALFTGMRRGEVTKLRWENIDLVGRTLHIPNTKNGDPLDLPLSDFLLNMFQERRDQTGGSPWVFPGTGKYGHFIEIKKALKRVSEASGVKFTMHDLRRTFITIAESLDVPYYALKRMLNHRSGGDVTGGYIVIDAERLRGPVEQVSRKILELSGQHSLTLEAAD